MDLSRRTSSLTAPMPTGLERARALRALAACGVPATGLTRADSVTNEVWLTDEFVVRVNRDASPRLRREAVLSQVLPQAVGYPELIQYGGEPGNDWLVLRRLPGAPLSRAWPDLPVGARREAVAQLADRMHAVHATRCPELDGLRDVPQLLDPAPSGAQAVGRLLDGLRRASGLDHVDAAIVGDAVDLVRATASALDPFDAPTLVHGDLSFENILWDGHRITGLLDFEFARSGPPDLDLDVLLRFVALPHLHVAADYEHLTRHEDYADVPWWLAEDYPELFQHPRQFERVRLYSLAWDVHELLAFPPQEPLHRLHKQHPYQRLAQTLRGSGYLDRFNSGPTITY